MSSRPEVQAHFSGERFSSLSVSPPTLTVTRCRRGAALAYVRAASAGQSASQIGAGHRFPALQGRAAQGRRSRNQGDAQPWEGVTSGPLGGGRFRTPPPQSEDQAGDRTFSFPDRGLTFKADAGPPVPPERMARASRGSGAHGQASAGISTRAMARRARAQGAKAQASAGGRQRQQKQAPNLPQALRGPRRERTIPRHVEQDVGKRRRSSGGRHRDRPTRGRRHRARGPTPTRRCGAAQGAATPL